MGRPAIVSRGIDDAAWAIDFRSISYIGDVHVSVTDPQYPKVLEFVQSYTYSNAIYCDCIELTDVQSILNLLNAGVSKAFVSNTALKVIRTQGMLQDKDLDRLAVTVDEKKPSKSEVGNDESRSRDSAGSSEHSVDVKLQDQEGIEKLITGFGQSVQCYIALNDGATEAQERYLQLSRYEHVTVIVPAACLSVDSKQHPRLMSASTMILAKLKTDRKDGLFSTVVSDESGKTLGLVYSSRESIAMAVQLGRGVYYSRSRDKLWVKGEESGDTQELVSIMPDCDNDALLFRVKQRGQGFCHLKTTTCFGSDRGISRLFATLEERQASSPEGSYTARLFNDSRLLQAKIMEEASELCEAQNERDVAAEAADLLYFALTKCVASGVSLARLERNLDQKALRVTRRKGDAKPQWTEKFGPSEANPASSGLQNGSKPLSCGPAQPNGSAPATNAVAEDAVHNASMIRMRRYRTADTSRKEVDEVLQRPSQKSTDSIMKIVKPIIEDVRRGGDAALLQYTHKFEKATSLRSPVLKAPFSEKLMQLAPATIHAIDVSYENIRRFHAAQKEDKPLRVETMPGVVCSRFSRPIERVGLYVPGGTAVLPSTALMLGVPAMVAGCKKIIMASPPRSDGTISPEIVYIANKVGAEAIVLAGGAQAVAALAYGTESISKVDKILGPGNQFVTAGKMLVSNDTTASVGIDMPAGPSEVMVIADKSANAAFVASDLLSQAEHGVDSQVVLIAINLTETELVAIEDELERQANALPRVDIVRGAIEHSITLVVKDLPEAMELCNEYAPEHLILQLEDAETVVDMVQNAGSVFVGAWTPESVGDYSAGVNHSLPTYGYAKQYSGVNLASFTKHVTSSTLTRDGLRNISGAVMQLASVEELEAHRRAVSIRLDYMDKPVVA